VGLTSLDVDTLGEDLVLLSIRPGSGRLKADHRLEYVLMGSELIRLAAHGRLEFQSGRIVVTDATLTGDALLDAALRSLARARRPAKARSYLLRYRSGIRLAYLNRLVAAGAVRCQPRWITRTRWFIADQARAVDARERLDAIALSPGQIDATQAAYGGLAAAIGQLRVLYGGSAARPVRKRMAQVARGQWTADAVTWADATPGADTQAAIDARIRAATQPVLKAIAAAASASGG
jgi:Golgi phosphoprotein 3 (GPP34)